MTESPSGRHLTRRRLLQLSGLSVLGLGAYSGVFERHQLDLVQQTIRIPQLPEEFHGLRIAQISDIHYDEFTEPYFLRDVVRRINAAAPDVVVMTGDFVSYGPLRKEIGARLSYPCAEILSGITCPHRFASLGNHDAIVGWQTVLDALTVHGIPTLRNRAVPLERGSRRLWIAGIPSSQQDSVYLDQAIPKSGPAKEPVILLAHEPDYVEDVLRHGGVDLMLSGHTHGGQVRLPLIGTPEIVLPIGGRKFVEGLFALGGLQLYVNRGIGTVGMPIRFNCPPELTLLTLEPAQS